MVYEYRFCVINRRTVKHSYNTYMLLKIDNRERTIIPVINTLLGKIGGIVLEVENLPLGDAIICDREGNELIIFERKSLSDLAGSIKDGRYVEQSHRLTHSKIHNHNIVYIIEGAWDAYNSRRHNVPMSTLLSTIVSLNYFKGFSVIRTYNALETAETLVRYIEKIHKEPKRVAYFSNEDKNKNNSHMNTSTTSLVSASTSVTTNNQPLNQQNAGIELSNTIGLTQAEDEPNDNNGMDYTYVAKRVKKENINTGNILSIMLSQIPNVSANSAIAIAKQYPTMKSLITAIEEQGAKAFEGVRLPNTNRRISSVCKDNVITYISGRTVTNTLTINI